MLAGVEPTRLRVLIAEDYQDTVESTAALLRLTGHEVEEARTGGEAIARTTAFLPDLVMLDVAMPGMDGYDTAGRIQDLVLPRLPALVAVSGRGDAASKRRSVEAGFDLLLPKPVHPDVFGQLWMLVERTGRFAEQVARLRAQTQHAVSALTASYIETCNTLLDLARTTEIDSNRERCIAKARQMCERVHSWIVRYPYLHSRQLREGLADLIQRIPRTRTDSRY
jgi:CheY-like chemotaxis protein